MLGRFLLIFVPLVLAFGSQEVFWLQGPYGRDQSIYFLIAHKILKGGLLYTEYWDHKPPGIHVVYAIAQIIAGYSMGAIFLLAVFTNALSGTALYFTARSLGANNRSAIVAVTIWVFLAVSPNLEASQPNTETFINCCLILAAWTASGASRVPLRILTIGVLAAFATLFKPIALLLFLPVIFLAANSWRRPVSIVLLCISSLAFPVVAWALTYAWFAAHGRGDDFYQAVIVYNRAYAGSVTDNLVSIFSRKRLVRTGLLALLLPIIFLVFSWLRVLSEKKHQQSLALFLSTAAVFAVVALPGRDYLHYFQYFVPCIALGCGVALSRYSARIFSCFTGALLLSILFFELPLVFAPALFRRAPLNPLSNDMQATLLAHEIKKHVRQGDWFYEWGAQPVLYIESGIEPRHGVYHSEWLRTGPVSETLTAKTLAVLQREPPEFIVVSTLFPEGEGNPIRAWISERYEPETSIQTSPQFSVLRRKGR